jgi:hypothetical protein
MMKAAATQSHSIPQQSPLLSSPMKSVHMVVQRYRSCKVLLQETDWVSVGYNNSSNQEDLNPSSEGTPPLRRQIQLVTAGSSTSALLVIQIQLWCSRRLTVLELVRALDGSVG